MAKQQKVVIDNVDANCSQRGTFLNNYKQIWCPYDVKSLQRKQRTYSVIQIVNEEYKTWTIDLVMKYNIIINI